MSGTALSNYSKAYSEKIDNRKSSSGIKAQRISVGANDMPYNDMLSSFMEDNDKKPKNERQNSEHNDSDNAKPFQVAAKSTGNTLGLELLDVTYDFNISNIRFGHGGSNPYANATSNREDLTKTVQKLNDTYTWDDDGNVVTSDSGEKVKGWIGKNGEVDTKGEPQELNVKPSITIPPQATKNVVFSNNLNAGIKVINQISVNGFPIKGDTITASVENPVTIELSSGETQTVFNGTYGIGQSMPIAMTFSMYDSMGNIHTIPVFAVKTNSDSTGDEWTISLNQDMSQNTSTMYSDDGNDLTVQMDSVKLYFDTKGNCDLARNSSAEVRIFGDGLDKQIITLDFSKVTQYAGDSTIRITSDGTLAGKLIDVNVNEDGEIVSRYSNGLKITEAKIFNESNAITVTEISNNDKQNIIENDNVKTDDVGEHPSKLYDLNIWKTVIDLEESKKSLIQKACEGVVESYSVNDAKGLIIPKNGEFNFNTKTKIDFYEGNIVRIKHNDYEYDIDDEYNANVMCSELNPLEIIGANARRINVSSTAKIAMVANNKEEVAEINSLNNQGLKLRVYGSDIITIINGEIVNTKETVKTIVNGSGSGDDIEIGFYSGEVYYNANNGDKVNNIKIKGSGKTYSNGDKRAKAGHAHMYVDKGENILTIESSNDVDIVSGGRNKFLLKWSSINVKNLGKDDTIVFGWSDFGLFQVKPDEIEIEEDEKHNLYINYGITKVKAYGEWSYEAKILTSEGEKSIGDIIAERIKRNEEVEEEIPTVEIPKNTDSTIDKPNNAIENNDLGNVNTVSKKRQPTIKEYVSDKERIIQVDRGYKKEGYNKNESGLFVYNLNVDTKANSKTPITFDLYNTQNADGFIEYYDKEGNFISAERIDAFSPVITSIKSGYDRTKAVLESVKKNGIFGETDVTDKINSNNKTIIAPPETHKVIVTNNHNASAYAQASYIVDKIFDITKITTGIASKLSKEKEPVNQILSEPLKINITKEVVKYIGNLAKPLLDTIAEEGSQKVLENIVKGIDVKKIIAETLAENGSKLMRGTIKTSVKTVSSYIAGKVLEENPGIIGLDMMKEVGKWINTIYKHMTEKKLEKAKTMVFQIEE